MTARAIAWLPNLDADEELAAPRGYSARPALVARTASLLPAIAGLFRPGDVVLVEGDAAIGEGALGEGVRAIGLAGARLDPARLAARAWCPTPRARRAFARAGLALDGPPIEVLRAVNARAFAAALGGGLPGAAMATTVAEAERALAAPPPEGRTWLCKRDHGFAGRGRRPIAPGPVGAADRDWLTASVAGGAAVAIEPLVDRAADFGLHGFVAGGAIVLGEPTTQRCDERGAWLGSLRARPGDLDLDERAALEAAAREAAAAIARAGYAGPFGVDAFAWRDRDGRRRFHARCEINARYSMGWAVGMGDRRPDREEPAG